MVLMFVWDAYGDRIGQNVTLWWEENGYKRMCLGTFVYIFLVPVMKVSQGVVSYGTVEGVGVGRASVEKVSGQMVNEVADRCDV